MSKKTSFLRVFQKIALFACVFCAFFISPVFANLPAGFTELEYIESTGTQWIDTGVNGSSGVSCDAKVSWVTVPQGDSGILGARKSSSDRLMLIHQYTGRYWDLSYGPTNMSNLGSITAGTVYNVEAKLSNGEQYLKVDGVTLVNNSITGDITNNFNFILFGCNTGGSPAYLSRSRVYNCKISTNNTLARNFIPAKRNSDNVVGMYDTVSQTFFTNAGTGDFIAGPIANCKTFDTDNVTCTACKSGYKLSNNGGCVEIIEIATTKFVDDEFAAAEDQLAATVQTIESVVSRTITQTGQIQVLQDTKQTRPDESCPANMKCLLVQDEDGTPHWYPIIEP